MMTVKEVDEMNMSVFDMVFTSDASKKIVYQTTQNVEKKKEKKDSKIICAN